MSVTQHSFLVTGLLMASTAACCLLISLWWHRDASPRDHLRRHLHWHVGGLCLFVVATLVITGTVATVALLELGGAKPDPRHIPASPAYALKGAGGSSVSADLSAYGSVYDQGATCTCGSHALMQAIMITLRERGDLVPILSPWQNAHDGGISCPGGSSLQQDVDTVARYGVEPLAYWPRNGTPDPSDALHTSWLPGLWVETLFAGGASWQGLQAVEGALDTGLPVILLQSVYSDEYNAYGASSTDNWGTPEFEHFITAVQHHGDTISSLNSWGVGYGQQGVISFVPVDAFLRTVHAAYIVHLPHAPPEWLPPPPPTATPRPPPTATPAPRATATPVPPATPTAPRHAYHGVYLTTKALNLRSRPARAAPVVVGVGRSRRLRALGNSTAHWALVRLRAKQGWRTGWAWRESLKRAPR